MNLIDAKLDITHQLKFNCPFTKTIYISVDNKHLHYHQFSIIYRVETIQPVNFSDDPEGTLDRTPCSLFARLKVFTLSPDTVP